MASRKGILVSRYQQRSPLQQHDKALFLQQTVSADIFRSVLQRRRRQNWSLHHPQHRLGADEVRRRGGHLSDGENAADAETGHGADGGEPLFQRKSHIRAGLRLQPGPFKIKYLLHLAANNSRLSLPRINTNSATELAWSTWEASTTMQRRRPGSWKTKAEGPLDGNPSEPLF